MNSVLYFDVFKQVSHQGSSKIFLTNDAQIRTFYEFMDTSESYTEAGLNLQIFLNPQLVTWGPFGPHSGLMAVYFRSPGGSTTPFKVVVRPPNVYEEICLFFINGFIM